jgi:hypothetical protein
MASIENALSSLTAQLQTLLQEGNIERGINTFKSRIPDDFTGIMLTHFGSVSSDNVRVYPRVIANRGPACAKVDKAVEQEWRQGPTYLLRGSGT